MSGLEPSYSVHLKVLTRRRDGCALGFEKRDLEVGKHFVRFLNGKREGCVADCLD